MKYRILLYVLSVLYCYGLYAQDAVTVLAGKVTESQVSMQYSYMVEKAGAASLHGNGRITMQGASLIMEGDGLKVLCDGKERWTIDETAKEAVVETVSDDDAAAVPLQMISRLPELFTWPATGEKTLFNKKTAPEMDGVDIAATRYSLTPEAGIKSDILSLDLYFDSAYTLLGADIRLKDGSETSLTVFSMTFIPLSGLPDNDARSLSSLSLTESRFDSSWIITDLR